LFAKIINKEYRWVLDKCGGKESISFEKLIPILSKLKYKNLQEVDMSFNILFEINQLVKVKNRFAREINSVKKFKDLAIKDRKEKIKKNKIDKMKLKQNKKNYNKIKKNLNNK